METFITQHFLLFVIFIVWVLFWKGFALWFASKEKRAWWFIALLILNTIGILDIIYIFFIAKKGKKLMQALGLHHLLK